jgi:hypothetical protein
LADHAKAKPSQAEPSQAEPGQDGKSRATPGGEACPGGSEPRIVDLRDRDQRADHTKAKPSRLKRDQARRAKPRPSRQACSGGSDARVAQSRALVGIRGPITGRSRPPGQPRLSLAIPGQARPGPAKPGQGVLRAPLSCADGHAAPPNPPPRVGHLSVLRTPNPMIPFCNGPMPAVGAPTPRQNRIWDTPKLRKLAYQVCRPSPPRRGDGAHPPESRVPVPARAPP